MGSPVSLEIIQNIAILKILNPPVNSLSHSVRLNLMSALKDAEKNESVSAIIVMGEGNTFPAGADITEFGTPPKNPILPLVCDKIEQLNKPVISAMHGTPLGGGLEIALSCHYRLAHPHTKLGLPEVHLGLLPGAGGTQRLPRLIGLPEAFKIATSGMPISAKKAKEIGLIDELIENINDDPISFADKLLSSNKQILRTCDITKHLNEPPETNREMSKIRASFAKSHRGQIAPGKIANCIEATLKMPFEKGQELERNTFAELLTTNQSKGLIHAFFAERKSSKIPEVTKAIPRPLNKIGVVGGGTMGSGITIAALNAGIPVTMIERDTESIEKGTHNVEKVYKRDIEKGRLSESAVNDILAQFSTSTDFDSLSQVDMVIEAVFEEMPIKKQVFQILDQVIKPGGVLASNTSYLDINEIATVTSRPSDVIGLHFFSPANIMRLLEIIVPNRVSDDVVATGFSLAKKMRKIPVRAGVCDGFIGNRILNNYGDCAAFMMEDGATPYEIDKAIFEFGYPMGPYQMFDLAGGDIGWATRKRLETFRNPQSRYVHIADKLCENGWFGQKSGRGFYRYDTGNRRGNEDPEVLTIIEKERQIKGVKPRSFSQEEIVQRYMAAMVNEAAEVVREGIALRPSDVDVTKLFGYGFPRYRGGPMKYADTYGLENIFNDIKTFEKEDPLFWSPSKLIIELVEKGHNFDSLNL
ncbi:MAG: 3-hydroxyacyl-CoA dehydrogenase NAD-binding domain-containing protein [Paracoccaceae bacterium]|nr:3-hydroxyacyl-CoA dehydrogenase NAD-binding domain-containing protein [Paracoccaceae bacterium]